MVIGTYYHLSESDSPEYSSYMDEVIENPYSKYAKKFYNSVDCGSYVICGDTIKVQIICDYNPHYGWDSSYEEWYKIVDKNTLSALEYSRLTIKRHSGEYYKIVTPSPTKVSFMPMLSKP